MKVRKLMTKEVLSCHPEQSLAEAAEMMWRGDCGCVPVCDGRDGRVLGMLTDRDICMHSLFTGGSIRSAHVADAMSHGVLTCAPSDSVADAERLMRSAQVRRLPVTDDDGRIEGVLSLADIAEEAEREATTDRRDVTGAEVAGTLSAICAPRTRAVA